MNVIILNQMDGSLVQLMVKFLGILILFGEVTVKVPDQLADLVAQLVNILNRKKKSYH